MGRCGRFKVSFPVVATLMTDNKWYESIQYCLSPCLSVYQLRRSADLRDDLHRIGQWCFDNLLLLNPSKTKLMVFGSRPMHSRLVTPCLAFMGRDLIPEHTAKDLGVILDTNLTYDEHLKLYLPACPVLIKSAAQSTF